MNLNFSVNAKLTALTTCFTFLFAKQNQSLENKKKIKLHQRYMAGHFFCCLETAQMLHYINCGRLRIPFGSSFSLQLIICVLYLFCFLLLFWRVFLLDDFGFWLNESQLHTTYISIKGFCFIFCRTNPPSACLMLYSAVIKCVPQKKIEKTRDCTEKKG